MHTTTTTDTTTTTNATIITTTAKHDTTELTRQLPDMPLQISPFEKTADATNAHNNYKLLLQLYKKLYINLQYFS